MSADEAYARLLERLKGLGGVLVAYSGGVDSTLLAYAARDALGDRAVFVLAVSELYPASETAFARETAAALGLDLVEISPDVIDDPAFAANPTDRCYVCKRTLFAEMRRIADARGIAAVADGGNADDLADFRPGIRAAAESRVISPLEDAGLTKEDIRAISRKLGLPTAEKPSMACLASRIPYDTAIDRATLARVAAAEEAVHAFGFAQARVRAHGDIARIEVAPDEMDAAWARRAALSAAMRAAGFAYSTIDLDGYRTGSMNETLPGEDL